MSGRARYNRGDAPIASNTTRMSESPQLGPFLLGEKIGEGGMGAVFRAHHRRDEAEAAIKVLTDDEATAPAYQREFRREVRALAKLDHPGIASIYDFGIVDESAADGGPAVLRPDVPWLAMPLIDGRPLGEVVSSWKWPEIEIFLRSLLDALAHAHARGVLHRDLKPSNILVEGKPDRIQIVDFGLATLFDAESDEGTAEEREVHGTPNYMAPEHIRARRRDQGPWTDLYAVGCLVWRLVSDRPAFDGDTTEEILKAHVHRDPGPFDPTIEVPPTLENWLRGLLAKDPARRCRRAADAAWKLAQLPPLPSDRPEESRGRSEGLSALDDALPTLREIAAPDATARTSRAADPDVEPADWEPPPFPDEWRRGDALEESQLLSGAGLELFTLRELPLIDREGERDTLWQALAEVRRRRRPGAVLLSGPPGSGKSRLARWISRRADEVGAALPMRAYYGRRSRQSGGLGGMIERWTETAGLDWPQALERTVQKLAHLDVPSRHRAADAVGFLKLAGIDPDHPKAREMVGFQSPEERNGAFLRLFEHMARSRPLLLWIDDAPRARDATSLLRHVYAQTRPQDTLPVFFVLTARRAEFDEAPHLDEWLRSGGAEGTRHLEVGALTDDDQRRLIERMLRFDPELVDRIVDRTEGHPLFAVQLVQDWVDRRALQSNDEGVFELDEAADRGVPKDLERLWMRRLDRFVGRLSDHDREAAERTLEIAATLGKRFDLREWRAVCRRAEVPPPVQLTERAADAGLFAETERGWRFLHAMLAEQLRARADRADRLADHHRRCAETLQERAETSGPDNGERIAQHWIDAGEDARAIEPLLQAARWRAKHGAFGRADALHDQLDAVMTRCGLDGGDKRRVRLQIDRAQVAARLGDLDRAESLAVRAETVADSAGWTGLEGEALTRRGQAALFAMDYERADRLLDAAESKLREADHRRVLANCLGLRGVLYKREGQFGASRDALRSARTLFAERGEYQWALQADAQMAWMWFEQGDTERAESLARQTRERAGQRSVRQVQGSVTNLLGEIARFNEEWEEAAALYEEARHLQPAGNRRETGIIELNGGLALVGAGRWEEADRVFARLEETFPDLDLDFHLADVALGRAACAAGLGEWERFDAQWATVRDLLADHDFRYQDQPWLAERSGELCREAGHEKRAERCVELADELCDEIGERP